MCIRLGCWVVAEMRFEKRTPPLIYICEFTVSHQTNNVYEFWYSPPVPPVPPFCSNVLETLPQTAEKDLQNNQIVLLFLREWQDSIVQTLLAETAVLLVRYTSRQYWLPVLWTVGNNPIMFQQSCCIFERFWGREGQQLQSNNTLRSRSVFINSLGKVSLIKWTTAQIKSLESWKSSVY